MLFVSEIFCKTEFFLQDFREDSNDKNSEHRYIHS
jgi:hypothetical protein